MDGSQRTNGMGPERGEAPACARINSFPDLQRTATLGRSPARSPASCEQTRSDRAYLNYLISFSGQDSATLKQRYSQWFSKREGESDAIRTIHLCTEVLLARLEEKGKTPSASTGRWTRTRRSSIPVWT